MGVVIQKSDLLEGAEHLKEHLEIMGGAGRSYNVKYAASQYLLGCCSVMAGVPKRKRLLEYVLGKISEFRNESAERVDPANAEGNGQSTETEAKEVNV